LSRSLRIVAVYWYVILLTVASAFAVAIGYLHAAEYKYTAELKVTPVYQAQQVSSGLSGLASLTGINLPGDKTITPIALYTEALKSRDVADNVLRNNHLMQHIFANEWDAAAGRWRQPEGIGITLIANIRAALGIHGERWTPPGGADLQRYVEKNVTVFVSPRTNITSVTVNDVDPEAARQILLALHSAADQHLRSRSLARSTQYIAYLERKLVAVTNAEYREALVDVLSQQERLRMMASSSTPYSAEPLGEITSSHRPTTPDPVVILGVALILGATAGTLLSFAVAAKSARKSEATTRRPCNACGAMQ
jgi:uncharacterized protein involved in exopolysaccharide biosynthesis